MSFWQTGEGLEDELRSGRFHPSKVTTEEHREEVERADSREVRAHRRLRGAVFTVIVALLLTGIIIPYTAAWLAGRSLAASVEKLLAPAPR